MSTSVDTSEHLWWLASRSSGIVAMLLLTFTVVVGLMMGGKLVAKLTGRQGRGAMAIKSLLQSHEQASIAALVAVAVHGLTLLGDGFLHPSIAQIAIPFNMNYRPFYVGLGVIAGYAAVALGLSFYFRSRIGVARWRKLHRFTIVAYGLAVVHALGAGTDAGSAWFQIPLLASAALVVVLFGIRAGAGAGARGGPAANPRTAGRRAVMTTGRP